MVRLTFLALALLATCAHADVSGVSNEKLDAVAKSPYWLRLLHFRTNWFFHTRSLVDGPEFFFAPNGKTDPRAELVATIAAFSRSDLRVGRLKQHPQCAFPERYRFLKAELGLTTPDVKCDKLDEYLAKFHGARSATLVFSSAYPNNPGSMFGHTFLRINGDSKGQVKNDLLDMGISYAAVVPPGDGGLVFAALGLSGGYIGQFGLLPYYAKVNEYSNSESRDLWEYDLSLSAEQTRRLLLHAWEIETNSWFDYYFFDENCAYVLLSLLEVARPDWDLTGIGRFPIYVIPGETIKAVASVPGAITGVKYRPSLRKRMYQKLNAMTRAQRKVFFDVIEGRTAPEKISDPLVLESAAAYLYYVKTRDEGTLSEPNKALLQASLMRRAELGSETPAFELPAIEEDSRPDLAHNTYKLGTSSGVQQKDFFQEWEFKFAFHDLLNDDRGYIRFSQIDWPSLVLRYVPNTEKLNVEHIEGLAITSLFPMTFLEKKPSWKFNFDYYSPKDYGCTTCHVARAEAGAGATVELFSPRYIAYALALANFETGESLHKGFRWGPKGQLATILNPWAPYKFQLGTNLVSDLGQSDRRKFFAELEWNQSFSLSRSWELRTGFLLQQGGSYNEEKLSLNFYF